MGNSLGPVAPTLLSLKLDLAKTMYPVLSVFFYFINFEHPLVLGKLGSELSMVGATGP